MSSRDLLVFAVVPATIMLVAMAAPDLPIRRIVGTYPSTVLRWE